MYFYKMDERPQAVMGDWTTKNSGFESMVIDKSIYYRYSTYQHYLFDIISHLL